MEYAPLDELAESVKNVVGNTTYDKYATSKRALFSKDMGEGKIKEYYIGFTIPSFSMRTPTYDMVIHFGIPSGHEVDAHYVEFTVRFRRTDGDDVGLFERFKVDEKTLNSFIVDRTPLLAQYKILGKHYITAFNNAANKLVKALKQEGSSYEKDVDEFCKIFVKTLTAEISTKNQILNVDDKYNKILSSLFDKL